MIIEIIAKKTSIESAFYLLNKMPLNFQPMYFSEDEKSVNKKLNKCEDNVRFDEFKKNNPLGFYLHSEACSYNFEFPSVGYSELLVDLNNKCTQEDLLNVFKVLSESNPLFGMACMWDEYKHRNQFCKEIGENHLESFVGISLEKFIPGIYFSTLISKKLLDKLEINIKELFSFFNENVIVNNDNLILFKSYDNPSDWKKHAKMIDDYCFNHFGFFSLLKVKESVGNFKGNVLDLVKVLKQWK